jgi:diguanylate cyclase (GGDEF)-like protein
MVVAAALFGTDQITNAADDLLELVAALLAALSCGLAAVGSSGRLRLCWAALATSSASWAVGEAIWSVYELALHREVPFPSWADLGFLAFPVGAMVALALFPARASRNDRRRMLLDGLTTATAITLISWASTLGATVHDGADSTLQAVVALAYPVTDLALLVGCVLVLSRAHGHRSVLAVLAGGLGLMAVADSAFAYTTSQGTYGSGSLLDLGWYAAFFLLAVAPLVPGALDQPDHDESETVAGGLLPYLPLAVATTVEITRYGTGHHPGAFESVLCAVLMALVLGRQALTVRDNKRLAQTLTARERQLRHLAFHDGLTGLANRALYVDRVAHALDLHRRDSRPLTICFLDLDGFKAVNDSLGHAAGDELLVAVSRRLAGVLSGADTLARLGGDEFAVLLEESPDPVRTATAMLECLKAPFGLASGVATVSASIGVARVVRADLTPSVDELLTRADVAMYAVKRRGKSGVQLHVPGLDLVADDELAQHLAAALATGRLDVAYQPIVEPAGGRVHTLEALARWTHEGHPVPTEVFIRVATSAGLLDALFTTVLEESLSRLAGWDGHLRVAVNLSPTQLRPDLPARVAASLAEHGIEPSRLVLELTETDGLDDVAVARHVCQELRAMGVRISVDDFGTGNASLSRLRDLPIDEVKIDRSFISRVDRDPHCQRFVRAVLAFAGELGLLVVAEGVEEAAERDMLASLGCHLAQGFLFSFPLPAEGVPAALDTLRSGHVPLVPPQSPPRGVETDFPRPTYVA